MSLLACLQITRKIGCLHALYAMYLARKLQMFYIIDISEKKDDE